MHSVAVNHIDSVGWRRLWRSGFESLGGLPAIDMVDRVVEPAHGSRRRNRGGIVLEGTPGRRLATAIPAGELVEEVHDGRKPFGLVEHKPAMLGDRGEFCLAQKAAGHDQHRNLLEFWEAAEIGQHVDARSAVLEPHVQHGRDDRGVSQNLQRGVDAFSFDASVSGAAQKAPRRLTHEGLVIHHQDGRQVGGWLAVRVHGCDIR